ncbi:hypothetical protein GGR61_000451 [Xanthomonas arboricola]|nr:hypothetical protein [Xanthomonas sp. 3058]
MLITGERLTKPSRDHPAGAAIARCSVCNAHMPPLCMPAAPICPLFATHCQALPLQDREISRVLKRLVGAESSMVEPLICGLAAWLLRPPTIAGHAASTSLWALMRHPCRIRARNGRRARTGLDGRCASASNAATAFIRLHSWSCRPAHQVEATARCRFPPSNRPPLWCGVLAACGTLWRHGCRHGASTDGFTACPASGEDTAPSTNAAWPPSRH